MRAIIGPPPDSGGIGEILRPVRFFAIGQKPHAFLMVTVTVAAGIRLGCREKGSEIRIHVRHIGMHGLSGIGNARNSERMHSLA